MTAPQDVTIRTELRPGDLGQIIFMHGTLYHDEFHHGIAFESYVAAGLVEFCSSFDPDQERIWIAERNGAMVGTLVLKKHGSSAQLRFFLVAPECRGQGLGQALLDQFMGFAKDRGYSRAFLWTTNELDTAARLYKKYGFHLVEEKPSVNFGKAVIEQRYELDF